MLHIYTLLHKSRKMINICSDHCLSVCTLDNDDALIELHSEFFAVEHRFIFWISIWDSRATYTGGGILFRMRKTNT